MNFGEDFARTVQARIDGTVARTVREIGARLIARSPMRTGTFRDAWRLVEEGRRFAWVNDTPYALALERGEGGRPPLGLQGLAELEFVSVVEAAAQAD
ncbi:hypothetical protein QO010_000375 [Caulobacter ginsengisoli]|uniref:Uncharacterized protein n=1 Tax=Caulobacter ginsengisoli TaxID=400775 RepID=A0ABU0IKT0_9CAUL|nr:hypothetical protein [Caulobacter ginsengisoli]MDQ0462627.1 hypothetical protein [Caulobacter ginsengisoli]